MKLALSIFIVEILDNCHTIDGSNVIDHYIHSIYVCQGSEFTIYCNIKFWINISRPFDKHFLVSIITLVVVFFYGPFPFIINAIVSSIVFKN